jgi:type IV pilus assembly protein PilE
MKKPARGVTLIELMVVIVVLAILASIAVPSYRRYVMRTNRTEATTALLNLRIAQEKFFLQNGQYADDGALTTAPPAGLGLPGNTASNYYTIALDRTSTTTYVATATAQNGQADDRQCATLTINETGTRTSAPSAITECWR